MKPYKLLDLYLAFFPFSTTRLVDSQRTQLTTITNRHGGTWLQKLSGKYSIKSNRRHVFFVKNSWLWRCSGKICAIFQTD